MVEHIGHGDHGDVDFWLCFLVLVLLVVVLILVLILGMEGVCHDQRAHPVEGAEEIGPILAREQIWVCLDQRPQRILEDGLCFILANLVYYFRGSKDA